MIAILEIHGAEVPSSARSKAAVERVKPGLASKLAEKNLALGSPVFIRIFKEPAILQVWVKKGSVFDLYKTYPICKFSGEVGPKLKEGDGQAPEGIYSVTAGQMNPNSRFHLSFNLGYPNAFDRHHARTGNALMVHGSCVSVGCYAMGNEAIEEIWTLCSAALQAGENAFEVHIFPFPLTERKLKQEQKNQWIGFWKDLQPIYAAFEQNHVPPTVNVENGRYALGNSK